MRRRRAPPPLLLWQRSGAAALLPRFHTYVAAIVLLTALLATSLTSPSATPALPVRSRVFYGSAHTTDGPDADAERDARPAAFSSPARRRALSLVMGLICSPSKLYSGCSRSPRSLSGRSLPLVTPSPAATTGSTAFRFPTRSPRRKAPTTSRCRDGALLFAMFRIAVPPSQVSR